MANRPPPPNDLPLYLGLILGAGMLLTCLTVWMGAAVVYVIATVAGIAAIGAVHYVLWGRGKSEEESEQSR
jgi:hypothetical protein